MTFVKASLIGGATVLVIEIAATFLLNAIGVSQHWGNSQIGVGPLGLYTLSRSGGTFGVQAGPGVVVLALVLGLLNGAGAVWLNRTSSG